MRVSLTLAVVFAIVFSAFSGAALVLADEKQMSPEEQEMMKKWHEYSTPGEAHKVLEQFIGDWDYTVKWWHAPDTEPAVSTGENEVKWIMGGRFIEADVDGTSMGHKFEGMGIMGYDNLKKEYKGVWIDTMGTAMMTSTGSYDAEKKQLTENGTYTDPKNGQDLPFRGVTTFTDKDNYTYELYTVNSKGAEFRQMEITYKRDDD